MGLTFTKSFSRLFTKKEMRILMVGLDAASKTTILYKLKFGEILSTIPTIGVSMMPSMDSMIMVGQVLDSDGVEDLIIAINSTKNMGTHVTNANALPLPEGILCAKASMLLQGEMQDGLSINRTLDLASSLEAGSAVNCISGDASTNTSILCSVLTIIFQFPYEIHLQDSVVTMARQYLRSVISSVQRVAIAISPSRPGSHMGPKLPLGSPKLLHLLVGFVRAIGKFYHTNSVSLP